MFNMSSRHIREVGRNQNKKNINSNFIYDWLLVSTYVFVFIN